jgi:hypothetical protein
MIVDSSRMLLFSLLAATLLGAVMGYCIALLYTKKRARRVIEQARALYAQNRSSVEIDLKSARAVIDDLRATLDQSRERAQVALKREEALDVHAQLQAQRIQTLESQVSAYEDQQIRLKRDFASYKSNKARELELARKKPDSWSGVDQLPVLQKRIVEPAAHRGTTATVHTLDPSSRDGEGTTRPAGRSLSGLSSPLSRELDIPSLAESELPDSVEDLDFELVDLDGTGDWPRG